MKLRKVTLKQPVQLNESNREAINSTMAPDLRFEQGFVRYSDKSGQHLVPVTNVKRMTLLEEAEPPKQTKTPATKKAAPPPAPPPIAPPSGPAVAGE